MRRALVALVMTAVMVGLDLGASACGGNSGSTDGSSDTTTKVIDVTFSGNTVTPNGERVQVGVNQPIQLVVKADQAGEIHVHSTPEQELKYAAGTTTLPLKIDKPGIITVESHALNKVIVQLEVK